MAKLDTALAGLACWRVANSIRNVNLFDIYFKMCKSHSLCCFSFFEKFVFLGYFYFHKRINRFIFMVLPCDCVFVRAVVVVIGIFHSFAYSTIGSMCSVVYFKTFYD